MDAVKIPMINFHIGRCVLGWKPVLYGGVPHWKVEKGQLEPVYYIPMKRTPDFKENFDDVQDFLMPYLYEKGFEAFLSLKKGESVCILVSKDQRFEGSGESPEIAIALASLKMVSVEIKDIDEYWVDMYQLIS